MTSVAKSPLGVLVIAELAGGKPTALTHELLGLARRLLGVTAGKVAAAVLSAAGAPVARELIARGADCVYLADHPALESCSGAAWTLAAVEVVKLAAPACVLVGHNVPGMDFAPRLAFRLKTAVAMGCVGIRAEGGKLLFTRPCHGGNAHEVVSFSSAPALATVRAGRHDALEPDARRSGETIPVTVHIERAGLRVRVVERLREPVAGVRLEDARVVVAGGRGLNGPDGFRLLEQLAAELSGAVGASRPACDLGWAPPSWQIGLTGRTVTPDLYIAVGISGAGHHMAGCGGAEAIVAINTDPDAAIFKDARFGVVGDYRELLPALIEEIRKRKTASA